MAHFYGSMRGARGEATRCATKASGISAHVRGWDIGARVELAHENGRDVVRVYRSRGSNGGSHGFELISEFTADEVQS